MASLLLPSERDAAEQRGKAAPLGLPALEDA
jgi:hypothetical protein